MLKSGTMTVTETVVMFAVEPLAPLTVTLKDPVGVERVVETVSVDVAGAPGEMVTMVGLRDGTGPAGEIDGVRLIVPLNPRSLVRVIVEVLDEPCKIVSEDGFAAIEKPGAWTMKVPTM